MMSNPHFGSPIDDFLREEGICDGIYAAAVNQVLNWQIEHCGKVQASDEFNTAQSVERNLGVVPPRPALKTPR
jgi:hypothetical protein